MNIYVERIRDGGERRGGGGGGGRRARARDSHTRARARAIYLISAKIITFNIIDAGAECPYNRIPRVHKYIIARARARLMRSADISVSAAIY
jgi:hypothetical protein